MLREGDVGEVCGGDGVYSMHDEEIPRAEAHVILGDWRQPAIVVEVSVCVLTEY